MALKAILAKPVPYDSSDSDDLMPDLTPIDMGGLDEMPMSISSKDLNDVALSFVPNDSNHLNDPTLGSALTDLDAGDE